MVWLVAFFRKSEFALSGLLYSFGLSDFYYLSGLCSLIKPLIRFQRLCIDERAF